MEGKWTVTVTFPDKSSRDFWCDGKGQAKRLFTQQLERSTRFGGFVSVTDPNGVDATDTIAGRVWKDLTPKEVA